MSCTPVAVLLQVAGDILAGEVPAGGTHATQDLAGDGPVHTHALHDRREDVVQLRRPLHLHAQSYSFREGLTLPLGPCACSKKRSSIASDGVVRSVAPWRGHLPATLDSLFQGSVGAIGKLLMRAHLVLLAARIVHQVTGAAGVAAGAARQLAKVFALALALQTTRNRVWPCVLQPR